MRATAIIAPAKAAGGSGLSSPAATYSGEMMIKRCADAGAGGDAEEVRLGEGIAEDALVGGATERQRCSDESGEHHPWQPDVPDDCVLGRRIERSRRDEREVWRMVPPPCWGDSRSPPGREHHDRERRER